MRARPSAAPSPTACIDSAERDVGVVAVKPGRTLDANFGTAGKMLAKVTSSGSAGPRIALARDGAHRPFDLVHDGRAFMTGELVVARLGLNARESGITSRTQRVAAVKDGSHP